MRDAIGYDALIVVTPQDFERTRPGRDRLLEYLPAENIYFVGSDKVGELLLSENRGEKAGFINEDSLIPFNDVYVIVEDIMKEMLSGRKLPRGVVGWYYQQFLKLEYARHCDKEYYFMWDGDTVPCGRFYMFGEDGMTPFLDTKMEYHQEYFDTLAKLFKGAKKVIAPSFISEHMLMRTDIMKAMLDDIEANKELEGNTFYEKILRAIPAHKIQDASFSEFETYGTYVAIKYPSAYRLREWHSFRLGAEFFHPERMNEEDYAWLYKDFQAISFEKNQTVREDHEGLFTNPRYREKLSAGQMLAIAQEEFNGGYKEEWNTFSPESVQIDKQNILNAYSAEETRDWNTMYEALKKGISDNYKNYELYVLLGEYYLLTDGNPDKTYLCYENALLYCTDANDRKQIEEMMRNLKTNYDISVKPISFVIVSRNNKDILQDCIRSIRRNTHDKSREIVVVDNASTDGITSWLEGQLDIKLIKNFENLGLGKGRNQGLDASSKDNDIFFLSNDTVVTPNSIFWLRVALYDRNINEAGKIGAGCCTNYEESRQLSVKTFETLKEYLVFANVNNVLMDNPYEEKTCLSSFALAFRRKVLDEIEEFNFEYGEGDIEDDDLWKRVRHLGCKMVMCRNSFIYKYGKKGLEH